MNYIVKSYFAIDERSSGTWSEEGYFSSIDDAKNFIDNKKIKALGQSIIFINIVQFGFWFNRNAAVAKW